MASRIKILEFSFAVYPATDVTRSRAFYEDVLGLTSASSSIEGDRFWVEYEIGPHTLAIGNRPFMKPSGDGPHVVLEVDDFEKTVERLRQGRVRCSSRLILSTRLDAREPSSLTRTATNSAFTNGRSNKHAA